MKLKHKLILVYTVWLIAGFSLLVLTVKVNNWFVIILMSLFFVVGGYAMSLKCPNCKKPVLNNPIHIFGLEIWGTTPWYPKNCSKCGYKLEDL
jgi:hypothetical protein